MKINKFYALFLFITIVSINTFLLTNCASSKELKPSNAKDTNAKESEDVRQKISSAKKILNRGNEFFQKNKFDESKNIAEKSIEVYPTAEGFYLLGSSEFKQGQHKKARESFEKALAVSPKSEQILLTYSLVLTTLGEDEKAIEIYKSLEEYYPKEKVYPFKQGVLLKSLKRYEESYTSLKRADDSSFKQKLQLYMQLGDVSLQLKKYDEAEEYFAKAKSLDPNFKSASDSSQSTKLAKLIEKGNSAIKEKNYEKSLEFFQDAVNLSPKTSAPLIFLGNAYILLKKDKEAEDSFKRALQMDPNSIEGYSALGTIYIKTGKNSEAIKILKRAVELFPSDAQIYNKLGLSYQNLGDSKKALLSFTKSIELDPKFGQARLNLGFFYLNEKRFSDSKREFLEASKLSFEKQAKEALTLTEISILVDKGDKLLVKGKIEEGIKEFLKAKKIKSDEPMVFNAIGRAEFISKKYKESENSFKASLAIDKENIPAIQGLIRLYSAQNKKEQKIYTEKLESLTKGNPLSGIITGRIYEDKKEFGKAEDIYKELLKKFPDSETVRYRLGNLYYKLALEKNKKEEFQSALSYLEKAKDQKSEISEIEETKKIIQGNMKFGEVLPLVKKGNKLFNSKNYREAIEPFMLAYKKIERPSILIKIAECHIALGEEEKGIRILQDSIEKVKEGKIEIQEAINAYFFRKGQTDKAEEGFRDILKTRPESYYSLYQLGLIYLEKNNYGESLKYLDRAVSLNPEFAASHIARGLIYYKQNNKQKAKEEFEEAMKKDSELELAPYNIGILYFNENSTQEAEKIFTKLTKEYPDFSDSFYYLSYIAFQKNDFTNAEKFIKSALKIERSPASLYAYIRILEAMYAKSTDGEIADLQSELNRELVEKFPNSEYSRLAESRLVKASTDSIIFQKYTLTGKPVSTPVFVNGKMIINYGYSVVAIDSGTKSIAWRREVKEPYIFLEASTRIFAASKNSLDELDIQTGKILQVNSLEDKTPTGLKVKSKAFLTTLDKQGKTQITSYNLNGKDTKTLGIKRDIQWDLFGNGKILFLYGKNTQLEWSVYDSNLERIAKGESIKGEGNIKIAVVKNDSLGVLKGSRFFELRDNGKFTEYFKTGENIRSIFSEDEDIYVVSDKKITKISNDGNSTEFQNSNMKDVSAIRLNEGKPVVVSKDGELSIMKLTGEILKIQKVKEDKATNPIEIYSVLYRE
ncbi:MAG: tetratricopeptide repeat protein [Leptospiraceae bacterium]|nr:tetratricopeptide repeat protein [Leptospiraceae bacterium]MCK6380342.1 tetratricopeptide repeat protein [Leptospiraceae bacterium]NUM41651.1 tetratricopeptide repeat protein [Leptospiraceae bacterium]